MFKKLLLISILGTLLISCGSNDYKINEGIISYKIDYPDSKDNFFLYHILPKELKTSFKGSKMEMKIKKASMENTLIIDSKNKKIATYFNYGELLNCQLKNEDINYVVGKHPKYKITLTKETDTLIGFNVKKAFAINPDKPNDKIEIWYTNDIQFNNSNWFNGFQKIPGVMLKYSIVQYGIKMDFVATKFENVTIPDSIVNMSRPGVKIPHYIYDKKINELFESFK